MSGGGWGVLNCRMRGRVLKCMRARRGPREWRSKGGGEGMNQVADLPPQTDCRLILHLHTKFIRCRTQLQKRQRDRAVATHVRTQELEDACCLEHLGRDTLLAPSYLHPRPAQLFLHRFNASGSTDSPYPPQPPNAGPSCRRGSGTAQWPPTLGSPEKH